MTDTSNPFADWPLHHLMFVKVRDGGGPHKIAHAVAEGHGITLDELKAQCRKAGEEWLAQDEALDTRDRPVFEWACS